ncbi:DMT family transporter [Tenacibaculum sp. M341]|uniref:DMT family transporter n=1 Tax=Tenacibaculum sp. M341 TaxID=2530339 RepID=UPI001FB213F4|nr:DMT family transporter [Tenacibaculum sp. M341]
MIKKAILFMIISAFSFTLLNVFVKSLQHFSVYQIVFFRSLGTLIFTIPLILKQKVSILGNHKKLLLLRGGIGVISLTSFFQSLNYLDVGTAVSIRYTSPIFAAIFALVFLKEKIKSIQWLLFFLALIGVLILKGFSGNVSYLGLFFVCISAISLGLIFVIIRKIGTTENPLVIINYFMIMTFVFGGIMSINHWKNPSVTELLVLLSLGIFGYVGQLYMTKAFQSQETSIIAPLKYLEVVFTILIGVFWFKEVFNLYTLLGVSLILVGLIYNIYLKKEVKEKNTLK